MKDITNRSTDFPGVWRSQYTYHSSSREAEYEDIHYVYIYQKGGEIVVESVPGANDSYLVARFWLDDNIATGSWQQVTSLTGEYKGAIYHGAAQLIVAKDRKSMTGKWIGFGKKMEVKTGPWKLEYVGENVPVDK